MVRSNTEAVAAAKKSTSNVPGTCQLWTRTQFLAPSAGDRNKDGDADANDGWASEPVSARVVGDRTPPPGAPLYFKNADGTGFGHRCISIDAKGTARSTDMSNGRYTRGKVGNASISTIEKAMGLTYVGWSRTITGIPIPGLEKTKPPKPPTPKGPAKLKATEIMVRARHMSMQFSDTLAERKADAEVVFKDAAAEGQWWVTGTEALESDTRRVLKAAAVKNGFTIYFGNGTDAWAAINNKFAKKGSISGWTGPVIVKGRAKVYAAKKVVRVDFENPDIGKVSVYPAHAVKKDEPANQKKLMDAIGKDAQRSAAGLRLAFMGADGNVQDAKLDPAYGNGFISCWDDKKDYPSTGHGTIDYIFRWKKDGRVRFYNAVSRNDKKKPRHSDHFEISAAYAVTKLKK